MSASINTVNVCWSCAKLYININRADASTISWKINVESSTSRKFSEELVIGHCVSKECWKMKLDNTSNVLKKVF